ncbi:SDR family NAD(P)-dependent oxidoreductase [Listeria ilorinensis]|uniref:SDR family NAD(P)-dependent oxidoreductase n=1 Tax=Listeria ilorinensis TaxID=2867439 RepID=UPI001EF65B32|nr:SDR family oxidoreductase [Listeria ilorinensis]
MTNTALITGSTSGIGKAFADKLAQEKIDLILVSRDAAKLDNQSKELTCKYGIQVSVIAIDLEKPNAANKVFEAVRELGLSIQLLINNAGFNEYGSFLKTNLEKEKEMISLHVIYTTEMMKLFLPDMVNNGYGRILNLGSTGSIIPCPNDAVYAATKAYILHVSKGINAELKGTGVSITTLCPGSTKTEFAVKAGMENTLLFKFFVMTPEAVAKIGYKALVKGKTSVITGVYNQLMVLSSKIIPPIIIHSITKKMLSSE